MRARELGAIGVGMMIILLLMPSASWPQAVTARGTIRGKVVIDGVRAFLDRREVVVSVESVVGNFSHLVPDEHPVIDQRGLSFVPHVLPILVGTTVDFPNSDPVSHNVFSISAPKRFNLGMYPRGRMKSIRFDKPGRVDLQCNVHRDMHAIILIKKNACFSTCGKNGEFRIPLVPAGDQVVQAWQEQSVPAIKKVTVPANGTLWVNFHLIRAPARKATNRRDTEVAAKLEELGGGK